LSDGAAGPAPGLCIEALTLSMPAGAGARQTVLDLPAWSVEAGAVVGVTGPSGSGKSTLLHLAAGLLVPTAGRIVWGNTVLSSLAEGARDAWRRRMVGLVFQDFHLLPALSALDNVLLPHRFDHLRLPAGAEAAARDLLATVGLAYPDRRAGLLSRGEQQRVALARALARSPRILLADEPTASLDAGHGRAVTDMLLAFAAERGTTTIIVSHDPVLLARLPRVDELVAGRIATREAA
jgi:putative ABC transport system ATP-binding protein